MAFRSHFFLVLLACAVASASNYQLNDALSAAIASVNISATYVDYFGSAPAFYPPACSIDWPIVTSGSDVEYASLIVASLNEHVSLKIDITIVSNKQF
jgi:hypothetical protein